MQNLENNILESKNVLRLKKKEKRVMDLEKNNNDLIMQTLAHQQSSSGLLAASEGHFEKYKKDVRNLKH